MAYRAGKLHPSYRSDEQILMQLKKFDLGTLQSNEKIIMKNRSHRYAQYYCISCKGVWEILVDNILRRATTNCRCHRRRKYPKDGRADILGQRYDSMIQRCNRDTHSSSKNYKGRGIRVLFSSRKDFILWALNKYPDTDFIGLHFDRIDNNGHYSKENLRLVSCRVNMLNTRKSRRKNKK